MSRFVSRTFLTALFMAGFALMVVGVLYLFTPVESLPSFLGGLHRGGIHAGAYRTKRADVALILGVLTLIACAWLSGRSVPVLREQRYARRGASSLEPAGVTPESRDSREGAISTDASAR